jgi:hypothetical protein
VVPVGPEAVGTALRVLAGDRATRRPEVVGVSAAMTVWPEPESGTPIRAPARTERPAQILLNPCSVEGGSG